MKLTIKQSRQIGKSTVPLYLQTLPAEYLPIIQINEKQDDGRSDSGRMTDYFKKNINPKSLNPIYINNKKIKPTFYITIRGFKFKCQRCTKYNPRVTKDVIVRIRLLNQEDTLIFLLLDSTTRNLLWRRVVSRIMVKFNKDFYPAGSYIKFNEWKTRCLLKFETKVTWK